jgi:hypothetical protein
MADHEVGSPSAWMDVDVHGRRAPHFCLRSRTGRPKDLESVERDAGGLCGFQSNGEHLLVSALQPGTFYPWVIGSGCPDVLLIARSEAGNEVARRTGPFCPDDEWLIGAPTAPTKAPAAT